MIQKLSFGEKVGFACGDLAANFVFQFMIALQVTYYVDVFGLAPDTAATMFFVIGIAVAFANPVMGVIADRTNTRWGKFRPWLIWTAVPFGIVGVLTFTTPDFSAGGKLIYAWITYGLLRLVYVINNVPYASLNAVISDDPDERNSASQYRQIAANSAGFIVASLVIPLINIFAGGSKNPAALAHGYEYTMGILMIVAMVLFVVAFFATKERVQPPPQQKTSLSQDMADLIANKSWVVLFLVTLFYFMALVMRGNAMFAYCKFFARDEILFSWINGFGLASLLVGVACSNWISVRIGKRPLFLISMVLAGVFTVALILFPKDAIYIAPSIQIHAHWFLYVIPIIDHFTIELPTKAAAAVMGLEVLRQFSFGISGPVLWSMMGDVADYGEWKTHRRASGTVTATIVFALFVGLTLGQSFVGWIYGAYGYAAKAVTQTPEAIHGVVLTGGLYAGLSFLVAAALLLIYPLTREEYRRIAAELAERRKSFKQ